MQGDSVREQEGTTMHTSYSQTLLKDHFQATQLAEHQLIHWTDGAFPASVAQPEVAQNAAQSY